MADSDHLPSDESDAPEIKNEYGLADLARLPLLEQVHRLYHAIQHRYPYKEVRLPIKTYNSYQKADINFSTSCYLTAD